MNRITGRSSSKQKGRLFRTTGGLAREWTGGNNQRIPRGTTAGLEGIADVGSIDELGSTVAGPMIVAWGVFSGKGKV